MKNIYSYIIALVVGVFALMPSIDFFINMPGNDLWFWLILVSSLLGFLILFFDVSVFVKILAVGSFINCFFSSAPYISFTAYISLIASCYFYILCMRIENWKPVFNVLQSIVLINLVLILMQATGNDSLLNFGLEKNVQFGTIGQHMQMGSLSVILSAMLVSSNYLNFYFPMVTGLFCVSAWSVLCAGLGFFIKVIGEHKVIAIMFLLFIILLFSFMTIKYHKLSDLSNDGRLGVWKRTVSMINEKPFKGHGIGTYQYIFPALSKMRTLPWRMAHNDLLQIGAEYGYWGIIYVLSLVGYLVYYLWRYKEITCLAGVIMIFADMQVHFPIRCIQIVPIIIIFLAYCNYKIKEKRKWMTQPKLA